MSEIPLGKETPHPSPRSRRIYIALGLLVGCFGIHNFYARRYVSGAAQLVISLCLSWVFGLGGVLALLFTSIWALIELFVVTKDGAGVPFTK